MEYLCINNLKFIIRAKGEVLNLDKNHNIKKGISNYDKIVNIKDKVNIIKCKNIDKKTIYTRKTKKEPIKYIIDVENDCNLVTNLDIKEYTDQQILNIYKSRCDIEVFFKYLKNNYKFQHMKTYGQREENKINKPFKGLYV